jgi:two-component system sensor histidine kinase VicK
MDSAFSKEFIAKLETEAVGEPTDAAARLMDHLSQWATRLGVNENRYFYVLDAQSQALMDVMQNPNSEISNRDGFRLTANMLATLADTQPHMDIGRFSDVYDVSVPIRVDGAARYVVGVVDNRGQAELLSARLFSIIIRAMLFGLVAAIMLSFLLSKTITNPIERLTDQAAKIADGDFSNMPEVYANDEIGVLTQTFGEMAGALEDTLAQVEGERTKLNTLFLRMADGVVAFDSAGKLLHVNPAAQRMLGRTIGPDMTYRDIFPNVQADEGVYDNENRFIEIDYAAKNRVLKIYFAPIQMGSERPGVLAVLHDITEERKLEQSRKEFVANVSHELRTPLTNIKGYTETLLNIDDIDDETRRQFLTVVYNETDRMTRIVKDLLTLTRLDYNRMEIKLDAIDLRALALELQRSMSLSAENAGLRLTADIPAGMPTMMGDRERIEQVLINIISNAIKYNTPSGTIHMAGGWDADAVFIAVEDTGLGVPEEDLPHLFERFYRVDKARSRESGGTGMGLSIAKEIVERHGGTIAFDSTLGQGSRVTVRFPRTPPGGAAAGGDA